MQVVFDYKAGEFARNVLLAQAKLARAATATITETTNLAKSAGRESIAAGGFGKKWQNALRSRIYPQGKDSINAAGFLYHKIGYAHTFEAGVDPLSTIAPKKNAFLWLPLSTVPVISGGRRLPAALFRERIGSPLYSIRRPGKTPLLGANIRTTGTRAKKAVSLAQLRRGRNPGGKGTVRLVPLYFGVPRVSVRKKFDVQGAARKVARNIASIFFKNLEQP